MVHVETIDLSARGVTFPRDRVGMVVAQPHVALTPGEPFQCRPELRQQQLNVIARTLEIAHAHAHGAQRTHFTIFPEFSIPGLEGVAAIEASLQSPDWPANTVVIGGVDGLDRPDYLTLIAGPNTFVHADNGAERVAGDQWVNCAVIWVKGANNVVERWIQPKMHPSGPENNAQLKRMFCGGCVYLFKGRYETGGAWYRFSTLICFDWIATVDSNKPWQWLLKSMDAEGSQLGAPVPLTWMFVIQHNPKPNHETFLSELVGFFNPNLFDSVSRSGTCIVFANNAGRATPGHVTSFGCTSLVLPQTATFTVPDCYPTHSNGGTRFRGNNLVHPHHDVLFRERGQCIHSFTQRNPISILPGPAGQGIPIENPFVFPIDPAAVDLRTPSNPVPAAVKWFNDTLDSIQCFGNQYPDDALAPAIAARHQVTVRDFRSKAGDAVQKSMEVCVPTLVTELPGPPPRTVKKAADEWTDVETGAITHVVHTLDIFGVGFPDTTSRNTTAAHGISTIREQPVEIVAISGVSHEQNRKHSEKYVPLPRRQIILVSRDAQNTVLSARERSILRPKATGGAGATKFNNPGDNRLCLGFQELMTEFRNANTVAELEGGICARLAN